jgi:hypothetical protein
MRVAVDAARTPRSVGELVGKNKLAERRNPLQTEGAGVHALGRSSVEQPHARALA